MVKDGTTVRVTAEELRRMLENGESLTDWARVDAMSQEEVERLAEEEDGPFEDWRLTSWQDKDGSTFVRLDPDVVAWVLAELGPDLAAQVNAALRGLIAARTRPAEG